MLRQSHSHRPAGPALLALLILAAGGCANRESAEPVALEMRLTRDGGWNTRPAYAPDGRRLAFSANNKGENFRVCLVPARGGDIDVITPDTLSMLAFRWNADGTELLTVGLRDGLIRRIGDDGAIRRVYPEISLARVLAASDDLSRLILTRFRGDNQDLALYDAAVDSLRFLRATSGWETDACFGPGPDEATVIVRESISSLEGSVAIWSLKDETSDPLPIERANIVTPAWSPDRRFLAYATEASGDKDLWVFDRAARRSTQLTSGGEEDMFPAWSPDGRDLAFARRSRTLNVFVVDPATMEPRQLTEGAQQNLMPQVSPDGAHVCFVHHVGRSDGGEKPGYDLAVVPVAGGAVRRFQLTGLSLLGEDAAVSWSPDGTEIAFAADNGSGDTDIYRVSLTDGVPVRVTLTAGSEILPVWSADGAHLSYTRVAGGETQVWVIPSTGGVARQVTFSAALNQYGVWSDDGRRLCWISQHDDGRNELVVAGVDEPAETRTIFTGSHPALPIRWSRDGETVLAWSWSEDRYVALAIPVGGSPSFEIGRTTGTEGAAKHVLKFTREGERFRDRIYPAGLAAYADGEQTSDIHVLRVDGILRSEFGKVPVRAAN